MNTYFYVLLSAMPRVLQIITGLNTGGAERSLFNLLNGGLLGKYNCTVVSLIDEGTMGGGLNL
jgi:hypothetical protein